MKEDEVKAAVKEVAMAEEEEEEGEAAEEASEK